MVTNETIFLSDINPIGLLILIVGCPTAESCLSVPAIPKVARIKVYGVVAIAIQRLRKFIQCLQDFRLQYRQLAIYRAKCPAEPFLGIIVRTYLAVFDKDSLLKSIIRLPFPGYNQPFLRMKRNPLLTGRGSVCLAGYSVFTLYSPVRVGVCSRNQKRRLGIILIRKQQLICLYRYYYGIFTGNSEKNGKTQDQYPGYRPGNNFKRFDTFSCHIFYCKVVRHNQNGKSSSHPQY